MELGREDRLDPVGGRTSWLSGRSGPEPGKGSREFNQRLVIQTLAGEHTCERRREWVAAAGEEATG